MVQKAVISMEELLLFQEFCSLHTEDYVKVHIIS